MTLNTYTTDIPGASHWSLRVRKGTLMRLASDAAMSGATPTGSPFGPRDETSRKLDKLMPARRMPVGASAARSAALTMCPAKVEFQRTPVSSH